MSELCLRSSMRSVKNASVAVMYLTVATLLLLATTVTCATTVTDAPSTPQPQPETSAPVVLTSHPTTMTADSHPPSPQQGSSKSPLTSVTTSQILASVGAVAPQPSDTQLQMIYLLQTVLKMAPGLDTQLQQLLAAAQVMPEPPAGSPARSNIFLNMAIQALEEIGQSRAASNSTEPLTQDEMLGMAAALVAYINQPYIKSILAMVQSELLSYHQSQVAQTPSNATAAGPSGMVNLLAMIDPVSMITQLIRSLPARQAVPNNPEGLVNDGCYGDLMDTFDSLVAMKTWALNMADALGKPGAGILRGAVYFMGSYDQCYMIEPRINAGDVIANVTQRTSREFGTKFCRIDISMPETFLQTLNVDTKGIHLKFTWGVCVPDKCGGADLKGLFRLEAIKSRLELPIENVYCTGDTDLGTDTSAIAAIIIVSIFGLLIAFGTLYDVMKRRVSSDQSSKYNNMIYEVSKAGSIDTVTDGGNVEEVKMGSLGTKSGTVISDRVHITRINGDVISGQDEFKQTNGDTVTSRGDKGPAVSTQGNKSFMGRVLHCFSLYTNVPKLLLAEAGSGAVTCVHGIRFLSLTWIILGHTYNYGIVSQSEAFTSNNLVDFQPVLQRFTYQTVVAGGFAVDTFFVLSAFLLTWLQLRETAKKTKKLTVTDAAMYYIHRIWRLTPIYMLVMMMFTCLYKYIGDGPFFPSQVLAADNCRTNWWTNLLYVNNLVNVKEQCMDWTWYLANDMQFYVFTPLFLIPMYIWPAIGVVATIVLIAAGMVITFVEEHRVGGNFFSMKSDEGAYWEEVYTVPWCRMSCWAVGMILGFIVYKRGQKPLRTRTPVILGWLTATVVALFIAYSPYTEQKKDGTAWTKLMRAFYESVGRPAWGMCVAWVIFACHTGAGGIVNSILSWPGFIPLSRLTYAAYLVHPIVMIINVFSRRSPLFVNDYTIIYLYFGHICMTYLVAFVASLAFEAPVMNLEKVLFGRGRRKTA